MPEQAAVTNRLFATIGGGLLAMLSYVIWPTWEAARTLPRLRALVEADLRYTSALFEGLTTPPPRRRHLHLQDLRAHVWAARASAEESLERTLGEPGPTHEIDAQAGARHHGRDAAPRPGQHRAFQPLLRSPDPRVSRTCTALAAALESASIEEIAGLRDAFHTLERTLAQDERPGARALVSALDITVDSIDTLVELWSAAEGEGPRCANRRSVPEYVYSMFRVGKTVPPKRAILKDISLSFFPGAKIGILGLNGAGKSSLLRIMAGTDTEFDGEAAPAPNLTIGYSGARAQARSAR